MESCLITEVEHKQFAYIVTLLDYRIQVSKYLKNITIFDCPDGTLLIDTLLCSGMSEHRFIEANLKYNGTIDLENSRYITADAVLTSYANDIIRHYPNSLENSILTRSQLDYFLKE